MRMPIREETKTIYFDRENLEHSTKKDAQLAEIAYEIRDAWETHGPEEKVLEKLLKAVPVEWYSLILEAMNQEEISVKRESLPERLNEFMRAVPTGPLSVMVDEVGKTLEEAGYILIKKK